MSGNAWDRRPGPERDAEQSRLLSRWLRSEVRPFSTFWDQRLGSRELETVSDLMGVEPIEESEVVGAGGPGNPALLAMPTEDGFKRHASRADLLAAVRELGAGSAEARRAILFRRYKPVHVHEAGVAMAIAIAYTRTDQDRLHLAGARLVEVLGLGANDRLVNAVPPGPSVRFWGLYHAALAARMTALHPRVEGSGAVTSVARGMAMLPPTVLAAPVDEALSLLEGLAERGVAAPELRTLLTVGPPPSAHTREALAGAAAALGAGPVRVQAVWAPEASRTLWGECRPRTADPHEATYGLHTYPDLEVVQVRDVFRRADARPGDEGEILLTSLGWRGTVLVRFATGAWTAGLVAVPCPNCGRTVPRLAPHAVEAAWQPRVEDGQGRRVRVDLRRAPPVLDRLTLQRLGIADWSLRVVDEVVVLGLEVDRQRTEGIVELARAIGSAIGVVPQVRLGTTAAARRPRLGNAGAEIDAVAP